jgi:hypothetical protein
MLPAGVPGAATLSLARVQQYHIECCTSLVVRVDRRDRDARGPVREGLSLVFCSFLGIGVNYC